MTRSLTVALLQLRAYDLAQHREAWADLLARIDEAAALDPHPDLIVLPEASYPAYFLHSRAAFDAAGVLPDDEVIAVLGERARRHGTSIAAGLVLHSAADGSAAGWLDNASVLFGPDGNVTGRTAKAFLWHFDSTWFAPGTEHEVFDVAGGRAGLLVCADARLPEIPRSLAVAGAEVIVDCTAWVSSGRDPATLSSVQVDYVVPARAIENGTWVVAADKVGTEADTIVYAGRSGVVDPQGNWVAQAPSDRPGIVLYTLDLDAASGPPVARRPVLYADAAVAGPSSRAAALTREALIPADGAARVAAVALDASYSAVELVDRLRTLVRALAAQGVRMVVLPDLAGEDARAVSQQELLPLIEALSRETSTMLAVTAAERTPGATYKSLALIDRGVLLAAHRQSHLSPRELAAGFAAGDKAPPVVATAVGNVGLLSASEGFVPELARGLKLRGAEVLAWSAGDLGGTNAPLRTLARVRANEERAYVVASGDTSATGGGYVIDPTGAVIGETIAGRAMAMSADIHRMLARWNDMAPGTNPVHNRQPEAFSALFAPDSAQVEASEARA